MHTQTEMFEEHQLDNMVAASLKLLQDNAPPSGYYGAFSGGKDSVVVKELARMAEVLVEWHYNVTTVDPPELVWFMKDNHKDVVFNYPEKRMVEEVLTRGLPTRRIRWCCRVFKESNAPKGVVMLMGIRAAESSRRAAMWSEVAHHVYTDTNCILPIFRWTDDHVWEFIRTRNIPYCKLYDEGYRRLGCIGCPMHSAAQRHRDFARWPGIAEQWKRAAHKLYADNNANYVQQFPDAESLWQWWVNDESYPHVPCPEHKLFDDEQVPNFEEPPSWRDDELTERRRDEE